MVFCSFLLIMLSLILHYQNKQLIFLDTSLIDANKTV